jgi:S1-C subfamily serine protease
VVRKYLNSISLKMMLLVLTVLTCLSCYECFRLGPISRVNRIATLDKKTLASTKLFLKNEKIVKASTKVEKVVKVKKDKLLTIEKEEDSSTMMMEMIIEQLMERLAEGNDKSSSAQFSTEQTELLNGVVRIYCTHSQPNFGMPWQRMKQEFSTSTGFVIDGNRILTNAHAVEYGSLIQVKKRSSEKKYVASVIAVGHECDLAMLQVDDPSFWEGMEPLAFGPIPDLMEDVSVIGYPVGGDSISISSGVVSRIEMQEYAQASAELLAIQIDAAVNPGNSGGPVVNSLNQVIGVAFQSLSDEDIENIGFVVPVNVIDHFLDDVDRHGSYSGVCGLGVRLQPMENDQLRKHFGMEVDETGILVLSTASTAPAAALLKKGDVVLKVDNIKIANDGTIPFREGSFKERVQISYYFTQRFASDTVKLQLLREGKQMVCTNKSTDKFTFIYVSISSKVC